MPRLLLKQGGVLRYLASINVTHDGSIRLDLVRDGISENGLRWHIDAAGASVPVAHEESEKKTKSITIHTSGRVNYHFESTPTRFLPCLMDLEHPISIVIYSVPSLDRLDAVVGQRKDDHVVSVPDDLHARLNFRFDVMPAVFPTQPGEGGRFGVEGLYALSWMAVQVDERMVPVDVPKEAFMTACPRGDGLPRQAVAEEVVYLRFRRAMYANDVLASVEQAGNSEQIAAEHIEAAIAAGPGLFPPNSEGVWTCLTSVPMRVAPDLRVDFEDPRYRAEVVELRPGDTRLSTVRVRFKVFDETSKTYVKGPVGIRQIELDARL